jgi:LemA protein
MSLYIVSGIAVIILIYMLAAYNTFVRLRNTVKEAFSTMDVYLKKRWDLIPNLVETIKAYARHENETLKSVVSLRNLPHTASVSYENMASSDKIEVNKQLTAGLSKLIAISESYPDLKANQNFLNLSNQLSKIEEDISNSRKYYNAVVKKMNTMVEIFPSNLIAKVFTFKQSPMFEVQMEERDSVKVDFQ